MASPRNQHCANCIGTLSFPMVGLAADPAVGWLSESPRRPIYKISYDNLTIILR